MSHRRLVAAAAALAAGVAFVPGTARAADTPLGVAGTSPVGVSALAKAGSTAPQTFTSPASASVRAPRTAPAAVRSAATGKTIYVAPTSPPCTTDTGTGAQDAPFCRLQDAVNAASPGDTIDVQGTAGSALQENVTVKTSGISIVGIGRQARLASTTPQPALTLDGVSNVTISNLTVTSTSVGAVMLNGVSNVTLDGDSLAMYPTWGGNHTVWIDGASSSVTVTRTYLDPGVWSPGSAAISVAAGASHITIAGDVLAASGISATGVSGLEVTGNTIQRGCSSAIDVEGASTGVSLENNVLEDAAQGTDDVLGGYPSKCYGADQGWAPSVTVAAASAAGTTADYNDFAFFGDAFTAPYSWAGQSYPTLAAFQAAVPQQGAHDTKENKDFGPITFRPGASSTANAKPAPGSVAIGSANPAAPGALSSDFYGVSPFTTRGAIQFINTNPTLAVGLSATNTSAYGISFAANVTSAPVPLQTEVFWGDGTSTPVTMTGGGPVPGVSHHTYKTLGMRSLSIVVTDPDGNTVTNDVVETPAGSEYTAYGPTRLLDTRYGVGAPQAKVRPYASTRLQIAGNGGIPAGVTAVALNVTVTDADTPGHITVYPDGGTVPTTSNLNFNQGQTVPNLVIVPVGTDGYVDLNNGSWGSVDLIADVAGYFTRSSASGYTPLTPARLVDTRDGTGTAKGQVAGTGSFTVQIAGAANWNLPPSGITAVALNVTVTSPQSDGWVSAYPDGQQTPTASNVNFTRGQTIANSVITPVGADGKITIHNGAWAPTDVVVDVVGYYSADSKSAYLPVAPYRWLDTRDSHSWSGGSLTSGNYIYNSFSAGQPDITGFVLNSTVTNTAGEGFLTVSPDTNTLDQYHNGTASRPARGGSSTLNWVPGETVPNLVQAGTGSNGIIDVWNTSSGNVDLILDVFGYYQND